MESNYDAIRRIYHYFSREMATLRVQFSHFQTHRALLNEYFPEEDFSRALLDCRAREDLAYEHLHIAIRSMNRPFFSAPRVENLMDDALTRIKLIKWNLEVSLTNCYLEMYGLRIQLVTTPEGLTGIEAAPRL